MLLEFRVSNFRSIRDGQTLSLVASKSDKSHKDTHLVATGMASAPHALASAVLYGPNASGKSTLLAALQYMYKVVEESATKMQPNQQYNVQRFKLDPEKLTQPVQFDLVFMLDGVRYEYGFSILPERVVSEALVVYQTAKPKLLFSRQLAQAEPGEKQDTAAPAYTYTFGSSLKGAKQLWQAATRPNALFLSTAVQLNSEMLAPIFNWIVTAFVYLPAGGLVDHNYTTQLLQNDAGRRLVQEFLSGADIAIADIQTVSRKGFHDEVVFDLQEPAQVRRTEAELLLPIFEHVGPKGSAKFELHEESEGTRRLYGLAAPVLDVLKSGRILVVDELDSSLHTLLVRHLVGMFHNPAINKLGAQLIFTTHDTALLDAGLFRRDQVWLIEKDASQASVLYPLTDFSPRAHEALERNYLAGRYGAVPVFPQQQAS